MPIIVGEVTSYDVPSNARDVSSAFPLIRDENTPFLDTVRLIGSIQAKKREWWDHVRQATATKLTAAYTSGDLSLVVADSSACPVGMIVQVDATVYRVTAVPNATHLTVVVADGGADAAHASAARVVFLGVAAKEGGTYRDSDWTAEAARSNVAQIFQDFVDITGTELALARENGISDEQQNEIDQKLRRLYVQMNRALWNNPKVEPADKTTPRLVGGVDWFLTQYGLNGSGTFSKANLNAWLQDVDNAGGYLGELWMHPATKALFTALDAGIEQREQSSTVRGEASEVYINDIAKFTLRTDNACKPGLIRSIRMNDFAIMSLKGRQWQVVPLAKDGDRERSMLLGEYTMEVRNSSVMGYFQITG